MRAANVLGARVRLETHVGGVRAGWAYCEWQELTYKRSVISSLLTNLARVKYKVDSSIYLKIVKIPLSPPLLSIDNMLIL